MIKEHIFNLQETDDRLRYRLPVEQNICVGPPENMFLFGGVGLASSISALEASTGRRLVWATAQYLSYARPGEILDIDIKVPVAGHQISQARATGHVGDREIFTVNSALGQRESSHKGQWAEMPTVQGPLHYPEIASWIGRNDLHDNIETRLAKGRYGEARKEGGPSDDGQVLIWARMRNGLPINSGVLSIIADFVPSASGHVLGLDAGANSLDNTIRIRRIVPSEWVLCDIRIHGIYAGFVHGRMLMFAEDGTLMASASQSAILRVW